LQHFGWLQRSDRRSFQRIPRISLCKVLTRAVICTTLNVVRETSADVVSHVLTSKLEDYMNFSARDGLSARTIAFTASPAAQAPAAPHAAPGWFSNSSNATSAAAHLVEEPALVERPRVKPTTQTLLRGQELFNPAIGQGMIYIVRSGCIRLYKVLPDGRSINLGLLGPNTIFTQEDTSEGIASGSIAEALVDSTVSVVEGSSLAALIADSPELAVAIVAGMTRRMTELQTLVEHLLVRDTAVRLATTLISLAGRFGRPTADGLTSIALPLTHQGLANMIGSNRVTVTRKLLELQETGQVKSLGRNALAVDIEGLRHFAQAANEAR
jgi:CRP-like cAMP-binding protein